MCASCSGDPRACIDSDLDGDTPECWSRLGPSYLPAWAFESSGRETRGIEAPRTDWSLSFRNSDLIDRAAALERGRSSNLAVCLLPADYRQVRSGQIWSTMRT